MDDDTIAVAVTLIIAFVFTIIVVSAVTFGYGKSVGHNQGYVEGLRNGLELGQKIGGVNEDKTITVFAYDDEKERCKVSEVQECPNI